MKNKTNLLKFFAMTLTALFSACSEDTPSEPKDTFDASIVCPAEGNNIYGEPNRGTFTDTRDGQVYKYTTIGDQVWMAENLKFDAPYSLCYDKIEGFCDTFGRFYSLIVGGEIMGLFDKALVDTICPTGWRVPNMDEWGVLLTKVGNPARLMSASTFGELYIPGSDECGFNSLPSGYWLLDNSLSHEYISSVYWTSSARNVQSAYNYAFTSTSFSYDANHPKMSIRCIKDSL